MIDKSPYPASDNLSPMAIAAACELTLDVPRQSVSDQQLIELWLHGRSRHTQRAYRSDTARLTSFVCVPLAQVRLSDLQAFADDLVAQGLAPASRHRLLATVKSLFTFGHRLGYLPFDTAKPLRLPPMREQLSNRILEEAEIQRMLAMEIHPRNSAILYLLYAAGIRVSELSGLRWKDIQPRNEGMQVTVLGKGFKTRTILVPANVKNRLDSIRHCADDDSPVFISRRKRAVSNSQILRVVKNAAKRAGISRNVVVHTLRHCHASHCLERGASIALVQRTLGHASVATTGRYLHARPDDSSARYLPL